MDEFEKILDELGQDIPKFKVATKPEETKCVSKPPLHSLNPAGLRDCYIAGGAVTSFRTKKPVVDYDIYPKSSEGLMYALETLYSDGVLVNLTDRSATFKSNSDVDANGDRMIYQVIKGMYPTAQTIFDSFDFSVCMGAYDCDTGKFEYGEGYLEDLASRTMRFNPGTKYPLASLVRVGKYVSKGFHMPKAETIRMALTLGQMDLPNTWEDLNAAIGGVYGQSCEIAAENEEFSIDRAMDILANMDHRNFNYKDRTDDFSNMNAESIFAVFDNSPDTYYIETENQVYFQNEKTEIWGIIDKETIPSGWTKLDDSYLIRTYKYVNKKDEGVYVPALYSDKPIEYRLGQSTTHTETPWIYCGKKIDSYAKPAYYDKQKDMTRVCVSVLIKPSDIMNFDQGGKHIQTKEIYVERELSTEEKPTDKFEINRNRRL